MKRLMGYELAVRSPFTAFWQIAFCGTNYTASLLAKGNTSLVQKFLNCTQYNREFPGWTKEAHLSWEYA